MTKHNNGGFSTTKNLLLSLAIILAGVALSWLIFNTEPEAQREGASRKTPMLVATQSIEIGDFTPVIEAMGTVLPAKKIQLKARIGGQVLSTAETFIPGSTFSEGSVLVQIDPADYQIQLTQKQSELKQAQAALSIEMGEQMAAKRDYQRLNRSLDEPQKSLILRVPQLQSVEAQLKAANAAVLQAQLNLDRTTISVPFAAQVYDIYAQQGAQINAGDTLADLVATDTFWVEATLPVSQLAWLQTQVNAEQPTVKVQDRQAWSDTTYREGTLLSLTGRVDDNTRMARVLIAVDDPISMADQSLPKLTLGSYVSTHIPTKQLTQVARIERQYVRKNDTIWLMKNQQLHIKDIDVMFRDARYVYVEDGLQAGDQMVVTDLSRVIEGAPLRLETTQINEN